MSIRGAIQRVAITAGLAAVSLPAFGQTIDPALVNAAKAEGVVMVYHTQVPEAMDGLLKLFRQRFGVRGEVFRAAGYDLQQRFVSESTANVAGADVVQLSDLTETAKLKDMGLVGEFVPSADSAYPDGLKIKGFAYPMHVVQVGIAYNSDAVKPAEAAKLADWKGLTDPIWRNGRMGIVYPTGGTTFMPNYMWVTAVPDKLGIPFVQGLAAQKPKIFTSTVPTMQRLAAGEIDVAAHMNDNAFSIYYGKGAPVRMVFPEPTPNVPEIVFQSRKPPHPNAAKLLIEWLLSKEGQEAWMQINGGASARADVTDTRAFAKESWFKKPTTNYVPASWDDFSSSRTAYLDRWRAIFNYNP